MIRTDRDIKVSAVVVFGSQHFWYVGEKLAGFKLLLGVGGKMVTNGVKVLKVRLKLPRHY